MSAPKLTRREFTAALGGIVLSFSLAPRTIFGQGGTPLPGSLQTNRMLDAWLRINPDGSVTVFTGKVELGQGIVTALAQIAADVKEAPGQDVVVPIETPLKATGGLAILRGNLSPEGSVVKLAGHERLLHRGPARIFDREEEAFAAVRSRKEGLTAAEDAARLEEHGPNSVAAPRPRAWVELLRKVKAAQYVASHPGEVCPAKWEEGQKTLAPSLDLVGKI